MSVVLTTAAPAEGTGIAHSCLNSSLCFLQQNPDQYAVSPHLTLSVGYWKLQL